MRFIRRFIKSPFTRSRFVRSWHNSQHRQVYVRASTAAGCPLGCPTGCLAGCTADTETHGETVMRDDARSFRIKKLSFFLSFFLSFLISFLFCAVLFLRGQLRHRRVQQRPPRGLEVGRVGGEVHGLAVVVQRLIIRRDIH
jgi:hypothetical protein